jgi:small-conductance mechanosensitive channel
MRVMSGTPPECMFDNNPLGGLCGLIDEHTHGAIAGPILGRLLWALVILVVVIVAGRVLRTIGEHGLERGGADAQVRTLVHNVLVASTVVLALLAALTAAGLPLSVLLTFGGLTSLAIGLAFQDLLRNVIAGIFLLVERPFRLGDLITVGELTGTVQTVELRTTALRLGDGRLAVIPNLSAFGGAVINASAYALRQFTVSIRLAADADVEEAMRRARQVLEATPALEKEPPPRVQPDLDLDASVSLHCQYWLKPVDHDPDAVAADLATRLGAALRELRHR